MGSFQENRKNPVCFLHAQGSIQHIVEGRTFKGPSLIFVKKIDCLALDKWDLVGRRILFLVVLIMKVNHLFSKYLFWIFGDEVPQFILTEPSFAVKFRGFHLFHGV
jgi:hypothetical protein